MIGAYHRCVAQVLARFGGFVAKYMGDGILAYFGYPQAHEEDAEQAVRAGLAIVSAVSGLDLAQRIEVRLGIATGLVVVGDLLGAGAAQEQSVVGGTSKSRCPTAKSGRVQHDRHRRRDAPANRQPVRGARSWQAGAEGLRRRHPGVGGGLRERRRQPLRGSKLSTVRTRGKGGMALECPHIGRQESEADPATSIAVVECEASLVRLLFPASFPET